MPLCFAYSVLVIMKTQESIVMNLFVDIVSYHFSGSNKRKNVCDFWRAWDTQVMNFIKTLWSS